MLMWRKCQLGTACASKSSSNQSMWHAGVVGQDQLAAEAVLAQLGHGLDPLLGGAVGVDAEPVHAEGRPGRQELLQIVEVGGVAAVADDHAGQVHALFGEDPLLVEPALRGRRRCGWRWATPWLAMDAGDGAQDALDVTA